MTLKPCIHAGRPAFGKWIACTPCLAVVAGLVVFTCSTEAAVIYRPTESRDFPNYIKGVHAGIDFDGDSSPDFTIRSEGLDDVAFDEGVTDVSIRSLDDLRARLYRPGDLIQFDGPYSRDVFRGDSWVPMTDLGQTVHFGVRFLQGFPNMPVQLLGTFSLRYDAANDVLHLGDVAYQSQPRTGLTVVPEPAAIGAMVVCTATLLRRRRRL